MRKEYSLYTKEKAVKMFLEEGKTKRAIAEELGIVGGKDLVKKWVQKYRRGIEKRKLSEEEKMTYGEIKDEPKCITMTTKDIGRPQQYARLNSETERRIHKLEMQIELLRNFLYETERRSIKR